MLDWFGLTRFALQAPLGTLHRIDHVDVALMKKIF